MTGNLDTNSLIKSTRNSGYAFQVKPDDLTPVAYVHTNGNAEFVDVQANNTLNTVLVMSHLSVEKSMEFIRQLSNVRYALTDAHYIRGTLDVASTGGDQHFVTNNTYFDVYRTTKVKGT